MYMCATSHFSIKHLGGWRRKDMKQEISADNYSYQYLWAEKL